MKNVSIIGEIVKHFCIQISNMYLFTKNDIAQTNLMQNISFTKLILFLPVCAFWLTWWWIPCGVSASHINGLTYCKIWIVRNIQTIHSSISWYFWCIHVSNLYYCLLFLPVLYKFCLWKYCSDFKIKMTYLKMF